MPQASAGPSGYTPQQIRHAYGLDNLAYNGTTLDGTGQTIAIVVAYDNPTIASDLQQFSTAFGLPAANLTVVKQNVGGTLPTADVTWAKEISLDVEWAHAIAPGANILLVEAVDATSNLYAQAAWAAQQPGVSVVSMSFAGFVSFSTGYDSAFVTPSGHQGVTFVAASGDRGNSGYPSNSVNSMYPADSPNVVGVGSTSLTTDASGNYVSEVAASYSGGGYSLYEPEPNYQINAGIVTPNNMRANPDVSFVGGDGAIGVPIYDAYSYGASTPWSGVFGTSASTPMFAGLIALANQGRVLAGKTTLDGPSQTLPLLYQLQTSFHDITQGGNAAYQAGAGYDFVSGLGTPIGNVLVPQLVQGGFLPLAAQGGFALSANAGAAFSNQELAFFSDPNGALAASAYSATIDWGDGTATTAGTIATDAQSRLAVFGGHTYASGGNFTITVTISSSRAGAPAGTAVQSSGSVTSGAVSPLIAAGGFTINANVGAAFGNQELATFSDPNGALATSMYSATIDWGDGSATSAGAIATDLQGRLAAFGGHTYAGAGNFTISVTIASARAGAPAGTTVQSSASVTSGAVSPLIAAGGFMLNAAAGTAFINQELATFSDPNGALATSMYSATIYWGDGSAATAGVIATDLQGSLAVFGGHTYANAGNFTITVTISSSRAGAPAGTAVQSSASIAPPPINLSPNEIYVGAVYQALLGRTPLASERQAWAGQLAAGLSHVVFVHAVDHSAEYYHTLIDANYLKYLGRAVDAAGQAYWTSRMQAGLTDESLEAMFVASAEYYAHSGGTDLDWVDHMYLDILSRAADPVGRANWVQFLAAGGSRQQAAFGFATSPERESQHIERNYQQYLGRPADPGGLQYWLFAFLHGQTNEDLITGFLASDEYFRTHSS